MRFLPGEWFVVRILLTLAALDLILIFLKGIKVDTPGYAGLIAIGLGMVAIGQYYRVLRNEPRMALALIAAGLFVLFTIIGSIFNYMFLPITFTPIDDALMQIDAGLGYHWPSLLTWVSRYPWLGSLLFQVYFTSLPQLVVMVLVLGFMNRAQDLHRFLLTGVIGALIAFLIWVLFPSFGPSAFQDLPLSVLEAFPIAVTPAYGDALLTLSRDGVDHLTPKNVLGLIGFPSFHTVMACMSVCFVPRHRILMPAIFILNAFMALAILVQGGHHLVDMFGGVAVFAAAYMLAGATMRRLSAGYDKPAKPATA